mmetsp:Transcript_5953/g.10361  ORF Transcript_5953/g.10361 Transcript_5953/m.10361 type:complete len:220 (-) Transcript_5953:480-1139(-)
MGVGVPGWPGCGGLVQLVAALLRVRDGQDVLDDPLLWGLCSIKLIPCIAVQLVRHPLSLIQGHVGVPGCSIRLGTDLKEGRVDLALSAQLSHLLVCILKTRNRAEQVSVHICSCRQLLLVLTNAVMVCTQGHQPGVEHDHSVQGVLVVLGGRDQTLHMLKKALLQLASAHCHNGLPLVLLGLPKPREQAVVAGDLFIHPLQRSEHLPQRHLLVNICLSI